MAIVTARGVPGADPLGRRGRWSVTFTGRRFWPLDPRADDVCIEDIAHHLSLICRFGGACPDHYSVAQHSVLVARDVQRRIAGPTAVYSSAEWDLIRWGFLHDGAEAYVGDVIWPLKQWPELAHVYNPIEEAVMVAIAERFRLPWPEPPAVKVSDLAVLAAEKRDLFGRGIDSAPIEVASARLAGRLPWTTDVEPPAEIVTAWSAKEAEARFLREYERLWRGSAHA